MGKKLYTGDPDDVCPLRGGRACVEVCPTCKFQQSFTVTNNATGQVQVHWDCAISFQTQLQMEGNIFTQGVGQAVESFRNETSRRGNALINGSVKLVERALDAVERQGLLDGERNDKRIPLSGSSGGDVAALSAPASGE